MRILGLEISIGKKQLSPYSLSTPDRGWYPIVHEPYTGAWQRNDPLQFDSVLSHFAVYRCVTLIAADVAKMRVKLVEQDAEGIWQETDSPAFSPVLRKPNDYQNRIQFYQQWMISKLSSGNTYVLKGRDNRGVVKELYILDPYRVKPLVAPDGAVLYQLYRDNLAGQYEENLTVPASEIIHDRMNPLFHPLCGLSPIYASYLPATSGLRIQRFSDRFFGNQARPSGMLTAPGEIPEAQAQRLKEQFEANYSRDNVGKVAVAGAGLTWVPMVINAVDSQLIDQLKLTAEQICSTYGVPPYKAGTGPAPAYNNIQALNQGYYTDCVQIHVESIETLLDEGLGLGPDYGTEFDLDNLLRMDTQTLTTVLAEQVKGGITAPDEARKILGYGSVPGGKYPYLQQQNYSLEALAKRDAMPDPFGAAKPAPPGSEPLSDVTSAGNENPTPAQAPAPTPGAGSAAAKSVLWLMHQEIQANAH